MTRAEFFNNVTTAYDVFEFCCDNNLDYCPNWIEEGELDDYVCSTIEDMTSNVTWDRIRDFLNRINEGYGFYDKDNDFMIIDDDDVHSVREQILNDFEFDDEEDDEDEDAEFEESDNDYGNYAVAPPAAPEVQQLDSGSMSLQDLLSAFS